MFGTFCQVYKMSSTADDAVDIAKQEVDYRVELFNKYGFHDRVLC